MSVRSRLPEIFVRYARPIYRSLRLIVFGHLIVLHKIHRKHALKWASSMRPEYLVRKPSPWITFGAIEYLDKQLRAGHKVFEYGSGGSTFYWISKGAECVSVEHDPLWYGKLNSRLSGMSKVEYRLVPPTPLENAGRSGEFNDPGSYLSSNREYRGYTFQSYASQIDEFPPSYFDVVLVDGRARPSCIQHAKSRLKPGGMLVVDNSDRPNYSRALGELKDYSRMSFRGVVPHLVGWSQTDIFVKGN